MAWPGSGHVRTPPDGAADALKAHQPPAQLPPSLAIRTGQTFTNPKTSAEASAEIKRLKGTRPSSRVEVRIERKQIADQIAAAPEDAVRVRDSEIAGHGSSAIWVQNRDQEPEPASDTPAPRRPDRPRVPRRARAHQEERVDALIADYLQMADRLSASPMNVSPFDRYVQGTS